VIFYPLSHHECSRGARFVADHRIPTSAESGMPGLEFASWYGVWSPRGLPNDIVGWLDAAANEAGYP
jgi:tripartite-type tricarboxylate transporter receptor subunit TctC